MLDAEAAAEVPLPAVTLRRVAEEDREAIAAALLKRGGVKSRAAQRLGLTLSQLNYRLRVLGIVA